MKPTLFQFRFREPTAPTTTAPELKQVPAADVILKPPSLEDWLSDSQRSVQFDMCIFDHERRKGKFKCQVSGRFGDVRINSTGFADHTGDAFIAAIQNITPRIPEEYRLKGF